MEWYVYYYNCNAKSMYTYNVFNHGGFMHDVFELLDLEDKYEIFNVKLKCLVMNYFSYRCEWEIVIKPWIGKDSVCEKIDVRDQIMLNWERFSDYVWNYKEKTNEV